MFDNIDFIYFNLELSNGSGWPDKPEGGKWVGWARPNFLWLVGLPG